MSAIARLSFWVPPDRDHEFVDVHLPKLARLLARHGLRDGADPDATISGIVSRLFEVSTPASIFDTERALREDPAWHDAVRRLGVEFGTTFAAAGMLGMERFDWQHGDDGRAAQTPSLLRHRLGIYSAPIGAGRATGTTAVGFRLGAWQSYTVQDGLVDAAIVGILEDGRGHLWFAGEAGGISRFDGTEFRTFTTADGLASNRVRALLLDRQGHLWFGTLGGGVSRIVDGTVTTLTTEDGLAHDDVWSSMEDSGGSVWLGTGGGGVSRYEDGRFSTLISSDGLAGDIIHCIVQDRHEDVWLSAKASGVSRLDGTGVQSFTARDGLADGDVRQIAEDGQGGLWFATGAGVSRFADGRFESFTAGDGLAEDNVRHVIVGADGKPWFGTYGGGVCRYDGLGFHTYTTQDGLAGNIVQAICEDRSGRLWFGTGGGAVSRYDAAEFTTFTSKEGLDHDWTRCACEDRQGDLWFGSYRGGVSRYDGQRITGLVPPTNGTHGSRGINAILPDGDGAVWFATSSEGALRFDSGTWTAFTVAEGLGHDNVKTMCRDRAGHLWFGTGGGGVSRYDGECLTTFGRSHGLSHEFVRCSAVDREGHLWFGTTGGVNRYDGQTFSDFVIDDGILPGWITFFLHDARGHYWFGRGKAGITRYDGTRFVTFTTRDGLTHNRMNCAFEDSRGHLWFGSNSGGVTRYDGRVFQSLTPMDGLLHTEINQILETADGDIWMATVGGPTRYRPRRAKPTVRLTDVIAGHRHGPVHELETVHERLTFEFQGASMTTRPGAMAYLCRMTGRDEDWRATRATRIDYEDLTPGTYTFEVRAVDRDFNDSSTSTVQVTVEADPYIGALNDALRATGDADEFVGTSPSLLAVQRQLTEVAPSDATVLITGETGTGKGLAARTVHGLSPRHAGPFIPVNCGAIPESLVESELFGHERGAFTGAQTRKLGKVELAAGGTLFLDEIGDLSLAAQTKLLRFLDDHAFERLGGTVTLEPDVRIVAATNRDLSQMVRDGQFREDLFFRLQVFPVRLPPLRERRDDLPLLAAYFMDRMAAHLRKTITRISSAAMVRIQDYDWPGNVRELEHAIQRAVIVCQGTEIHGSDISIGATGDDDGSDELVSLEAVERRYIERVLKQTDWVVNGPSGAAAVLGLHPSTLRARLKKLGIARPK